jgi:hypothetical protein
MLVPIRNVPTGEDPRIVIECIRACVWATVEGRTFCPLRDRGGYTAPTLPVIGSTMPVM